jgi:uncharacterized protein YneF (UPF0154 family)
MIWLALAFVFIVGLIGGIALTMWMVRKDIRQSDLCSDDRRMIEDVLGIRP